LEDNDGKRWHYKERSQIRNVLYIAANFFPWEEPWNLERANDYISTTTEQYFR
jgi:hypothetical protein